MTTQLKNILLTIPACVTDSNLCNYLMSLVLETPFASPEELKEEISPFLVCFSSPIRLRIEISLHVYDFVKLSTFFFFFQNTLIGTNC